MENISDYIPLIIIVGSIIISVVKGAGKKAKEEMAKTTLPGREIVSENRKIPSKKIQQKEVRVSQTKSAQKEFSSANTHVSKVAFQNEALLTEEMENEPCSFDFENAEEVRRAFVYSEILNRKEY